MKKSENFYLKIFIFLVVKCSVYLNRHAVLALTVEFRKSQDFLILISGSPGNQIVSLTSEHLTSIFLNSHLWSKTAIFKLNNIQILSKFFL